MMGATIMPDCAHGPCASTRVFDKLEVSRVIFHEYSCHVAAPFIVRLAPLLCCITSAPSTSKWTQLNTNPYKRLIIMFYHPEQAMSFFGLRKWPTPACLPSHDLTLAFNANIICMIIGNEANVAFHGSSEHHFLPRF